MTPPIEDRKELARAWFEELRDLICARFEAIEDALGGVNAERFAGTEPGRFERKAWTRPGGDGGDGGGGVMSVMRGRVFTCTAGTSGDCIWATSEMPAAQNRPSSSAPGICLRNSSENAPKTVETLTPTFSNTRPRITDVTPPPPPS